MKLRPPIQPFPLDYCPPIISDVVKELAAATKSPIPLIFGTVFSAAALACQAVADIKLHHGSIAPLSLYIWTIADSGERKSKNDREVFAYIRDLESRLRKDYAHAMTEYEAELATWKAVGASHKQKIKCASDKDMKVRVDAHIAHQKEKPFPPRETQFFYENATPLAVAYGLYSKSPSAILLSDDAGNVLFGPATSDTSFLNRAWDGSVQKIDRRNGTSFSLEAYRFSMSIMVQEQIFEDYLKSKRGSRARASGLLARGLLSFPDSTIGSRPAHLIDYTTTISIERFLERCGALHHRALAAEDGVNEKSRTVIELSLDARWNVIEFYNAVEAMQAPGGYLSDITDFASKIPENATRIAGIFYLMTGASGPLSGELMSQAIAVANWYVGEFKRLMGDNVVPQEVVDAEVLEKWFRDRLPYPSPSIDFEKSHLENSGPYATRKIKKLEPALAVLQARKLVFLYQDGKKRKVRFYAAPFSPAY